MADVEPMARHEAPKAANAGTLLAIVVTKALSSLILGELTAMVPPDVKNTSWYWEPGLRPGGTVMIPAFKRDAIPTTASTSKP
ncbi:MAG: hypothetical protein ABSB88_08825 [Bryobacteraceae bacterium]